MKFLKANYWIIFILLVALILRLVGIFYAYPLTLASDETPTTLASLKMLGTFSLRINAFGYYYPALPPYVYLPFFAAFLVVALALDFFASVAALKEAVLLNPGLFVMVARLISVFLGVASVYLVYRVTQKLFSRAVISWLAAWFSAINFLHVANSHYANTWVMQTFFILLAFYWAAVFWQKTSVGKKDYLVGALAIGAAFGINTVGLLSYGWFLLAHWFKNRKLGWFKAFILNKNFWWLNLTLLLLIILIYWLNPYGLNNYLHRLFSDEPALSSSAILNNQAQGTYEPFSLNTLAVSTFYFKNIFFQDLIVFALAVLGSIWLWRRNKIIFLFLAVWPIFYILMLSPLTRPNGRYILPVFPLLVIAAAFAVNEIFERTKLGKNWKIIVILLVSLYSILLTALFDLRMTKEDTRVLARDWVVKNIPSGALIQNTGLGDALYLTEDKKSIEVIRDNLPDLFSSKRKYLLSLSLKDYPAPNYFLINYPAMIKSSPPPDYVILANFDFKQLREEKNDDFLKRYSKLKAFYSTQPTENKNIPVPQELDVPYNNSAFNPWSLFRQLDFYGPYIEIYKLN